MTYTDESGRLHVVDAEDNATPVYAKLSGAVTGSGTTSITTTLSTIDGGAY